MEQGPVDPDFVTTAQNLIAFSQLNINNNGQNNDERTEGLECKEDGKLDMVSLKFPGEIYSNHINSNYSNYLRKYVFQSSAAGYSPFKFIRFF